MVSVGDEAWSLSYFSRGTCGAEKLNKLVNQCRNCSSGVQDLSTSSFGVQDYETFCTTLSIRIACENFDVLFEKLAVACAHMYVVGNSGGNLLL